MIDPECTPEELADMIAENAAELIGTSLVLLEPLLPDATIAPIRSSLCRLDLITAIREILLPVRSARQGPRW